MESVYELKRKLGEAGLSRVADQIARLARPCYTIKRLLRSEDEIPAGASKFGGSPDVPAGFFWPTAEGSKGPMEFVGQIRLADLLEPLPEAIPRTGLLSFFTRWSDGRVYYYPEGTPLQRASGLPPSVAPAPSGFWQHVTAALKRRPDECRTYRACTLEFVHAVQNEMELECDSIRRGEEMRWDLPQERFIAAAADWVLLLQVDTDDYKEGPGWMWGDAGIVYFWIHRDDLTARAFDKVIAIEQCH